jgi:5-methylcytosine-specific restriction protein A
MDGFDYDPLELTADPALHRDRRRAGMRTPRAYLCSMPGCPNVIADRPGRCAEHRRGAGRGSVGYGSAWAKVRNRYIAEHPVCERCGSSGPWLDVHHIDGRSPLDPGANGWANLQTLCRSCHRRDTEHAKRRSAASETAT